MINKEPDQRLAKTLLKGFAQGSLGGYFVFKARGWYGHLQEKKTTIISGPRKLLMLPVVPSLKMQLLTGICGSAGI